MSCGGCNQVIGNCAGRLTWCVHPGTVFTGSLQRRDENTGDPVDWPAGTIGKLVITWGTGTLLEYAVSFSGSFLTLDLTMSQTTQLPRGACVELWLDYTGTGTAWNAFMVGGKVPAGCC